MAIIAKPHRPEKPEVKQQSKKKSPAIKQPEPVIVPEPQTEENEDKQEDD
jgi:hypothetical protein